MPVRITSRYSGLPVYTASDAKGAPHPTVAIRPYVPLALGVTSIQHRVSGVESMEYLAWRYYGTSEAWWRIAEANPLAFPLDLKPGAAVSVPSVEDLGRVVRTRRF